jgi:beta-lactamase class A
MNALDGIRQLAGGFSGVLGVWAQALPSGETIQWNTQEVFPAASTIKLPILYEVYRQVGEGRFRLTDPVTATADDVVGGSGILKELTPGLTLSIRDMATLMIVVSDNTAANLLIDLVGLEAVNRSMQALGLRRSVLAHKLMQAALDASSNNTTPADLGALMTLLARRAILTPPACEEILQILRRQHYTNYTTRRIPEFDGYQEPGGVPAVTVASKSGSVRGTRNDVALVESPTCRYVIAMMSRDCADRRFYVDNEAAVLLADVSALIYTHFNVGQPSHRGHVPPGREGRERS